MKVETYSTPPGVKYDEEKPRWDLLPIKATREIVRVLTYGALKYSPDNWRRVPDGRRRYYAAAMRHMTAYWDGETHDEQSGLHHLAHAGCCLLYLMSYEMEERGDK